MRNLSLRKYAATLGVSHTAVAKAIKAGHIKKGFDKKTKRIKVTAANKEWGDAAKEKHKHKITTIKIKELPKQTALMTAFGNYFNAYAALINEIEEEFKKCGL